MAATEQQPDEVAAAVLARALGDAVNPARPSGTSHLGNALLYPAALRAVALLADAGWHLVPLPRVQPSAAGRWRRGDYGDLEPCAG